VAQRKHGQRLLQFALEPLVEAGLLGIVTGGADVARAAVAAPLVTHVHLTGGQGAFNAIVWGDRDPHAAGAEPVLAKPITCELGNVTPWIIVPGRYTPAQLACQADTVAASIANNTSFNCIATKLVVTCRSWEQREDFLQMVRRRLDSLPARPGWYPGAVRAWEEATGRKAPDDGTLPWVFAFGIDPREDDRLLRREWFVPVAADVPLVSLPGALVTAVVVPVVLLGVFWSGLYACAQLAGSFAS
jgi:acyl-CoA reductase-like NAD-dependent aldehyde dehydrogenase